MCVTACGGDDGSNYIFKYDISGNPTTIDPQSATDDSALMVIENVFEGLLRLDENGDVAPAVAKSYTVSDDGKEYTFILREDVYWTDGREFEAQCTAEDFVCGFKRLFDSSTKAPRASEFYCIKNSRIYNEGRISEFPLVGIKADGDFRLIITLSEPNPLFPVLLTTAPAMPCNEEFYKSTKGKYGLSADSIASNGGFYIYEWTYDKWSTNDNKLILRRNALNNKVEQIFPYGLNFFIYEEDSLANFYDETAHSIVASGDMAVELLGKEIYPYEENNNATWGIIFNMKSVFADRNLRYALSMSINRSSYSMNSTGFLTAESLIPDAITLMEIVYREFAGNKLCMPYDAKSAANYYEAALKTVDIKDVTGLSVIMPENETVKNYMGYIMQDWQANIGFFCNLTALSASAYNKALTDGDFDFAIVRLTGGYNSPSAYLTEFTKNSASNYSSYADEEYLSLIERAEISETVEESAALYKQAEEKLLNDAVFIPLMFQTEYFFLNKDCEDIQYNPFTKTINYRQAKHF